MDKTTEPPAPTPSASYRTPAELEALRKLEEESRLPLRYEDLPPTPAEVMEARNRLVAAENDKRERLRIARDNRAKGLAEPKPGMKMFVSLDRAIEARRRAGARFERGHRSTILVVDKTDDEVAKIQDEGIFPKGVDSVVNVYGAEQILEDDALMVHQSAAGPEDMQALARENEALQNRNDELAQEIARLRNARLAAPPSEHGEPSRLIAARQAAAAPGDEFGKEPSSKVVAQPNPTSKLTK